MLAQDTTAEGPQGLINQESISYASDERSLLTLMVYEFEDESLAGSASDLVVEELAFDLGDDEITVTGQSEVEGLDEVGDERYVIEAIIEAGVSSYTLIVGDATYVHVWTLLSSDATRATNGGTPAATPEGTPVVGGAPLDLLVELANGWFAEVDSTGLLADQLPTEQFIPKGYEEPRAIVAPHIGLTTFG